MGASWQLPAAQDRMVSKSFRALSAQNVSLLLVGHKPMTAVMCLPCLANARHSSSCRTRCSSWFVPPASSDPQISHRQDLGSS
jgi:phosphohistidine phosphatase SixA